MYKILLKRWSGFIKYPPLFLIFFLGVSFQQIQAQETVSGTVTDENGMPLLGVNVLVKNTSNGTTTDFDGNFEINTGESATLVFSFIGFISKEVEVAGGEQLSVTLSEDSESLDEVLVIGYGSQLKEEISGSFSRIVQTPLFPCCHHPRSKYICFPQACTRIWQILTVK